MDPPVARDPWRVVWRVGTSAGLLATLLLAVATALAITAWLPQMPDGPAAAYAEWRSQLQARFGGLTGVMDALGLFTITTSLGFRLLLSLLAGCLVLRLAELAGGLRQPGQLAQPTGAWHDLPGLTLNEAADLLRERGYRVTAGPSLLQAHRRPWAEWCPLVAHAGALLLMAGLLVAHTLGWQAEGLVVRSGESVSVPGTEEWVALDAQSGTLRYSQGIIAYAEERGPAVLARAVDEAGAPLELQQSAGSDPVDELYLALTEDQFFAVPGAGLVIRLVAEQDRTAGETRPIPVQVYLSPPGELGNESQLLDQASLPAGEATLLLTRASYARVTASFSPGRWVSAAGIALLLAGALGVSLLGSSRIWLRDTDGELQAAGALPPALPRMGEV
jgi:hypothetical protein